jgi:hypothetical protein
MSAPPCFPSARELLDAEIVRLTPAPGLAETATLRLVGPAGETVCHPQVSPGLAPAEIVIADLEQRVAAGQATVACLSVRVWVRPADGFVLHTDQPVDAGARLVECVAVLAAELTQGAPYGIFSLGRLQRDGEGVTVPPVVFNGVLPISEFLMGHDDDFLPGDPMARGLLAGLDRVALTF